MERKRSLGWAVVLLGATVLGGAARPAEAQPKAAHAQELKEAERLGAEADKLEKAGQYDAALPLFERALSIREKALGPDHPLVAQSLHGLARLCWEKGDYARAEALYQRSLLIREKALGPDHPLVADSLNNLAIVYSEEGEYARAEALYQRALSISEKALGPDNPDVARKLHNLANLYMEKGEYVRAEALHQRALSIFEKAHGPDHPLVASALQSLANVYTEKGEYARAETSYQRALSIREKVLGPDHPEVAEPLRGLAALAEVREDSPRALALSQRAAEVREKTLALILATGAQAQKRAYLATIAQDLDHDPWRAVHTGDRKAAALALTTLLRRKGRALDATAESMRVLRRRLGAEEQKLFDEGADERVLRQAPAGRRAERGDAPGASLDAFAKRSPAPLLLGELHRVRGLDGAGR